jgi:hypothetical protein
MNLAAAKVGEGWFTEDLNTFLEEFVNQLATVNRSGPAGCASW